MNESPPVPQLGIFALGTASHAYLEFDLGDGAVPGALVSALADLREPRTTIGGVNLVIGVRPELWRELQPDGLPDDLTGFNRPVTGADGFSMPATQHDAVLWLSGSAYDVVFDEARSAMKALTGVATVAHETSSWPYRHDRDLTGFIDGTENPSLAEAPEVALIGAGRPGAGGSVLLLQRWPHDVQAWESMSQTDQEQVMGRTKDDSTELEDKPDTSHVARNDQDDFGHVFRRNMPYGTVTDHGTMFVGFAASQDPLQRMLESMAGVAGPRDALTRYTTPASGAYYFVPPLSAIRAFASDPEAG
ncbi:MAG TPA: Dyp-type peroxidase [Solirubrobacteraceae bacterium]|nr:Dyp-type peroxidase [Solirubrobacteraceae bacterium]